VLQPKCVRIATNAPWYIGNKQIHDDLGVPYFSDHIRHLTESFDFKLADVGIPLVARLGRHALAESWPALQTGGSVHFLTTLTAVFPRFFLSC
jgi:hypothetical protein